MNIRELEDKLFAEWMKEAHIQPFTVDGCPNPDIYIKEKVKTIFVLKDANLANNNDQTFLLRKQLEKEPHKWWHTIAKWCFFLQFPDQTWEQAEKLLTPKNKTAIRQTLSHHCFVQLKKEGGGGSISDEQLHNATSTPKYKDYFIRQLSIYQPDFIVGCGNGEHLKGTLNLSYTDVQQTSNGTRYWSFALSGKHTYLIDYCHPSVRCGTKVKGLIARGLSEAISEIKNGSSKH